VRPLKKFNLPQSELEFQANELVKYHEVGTDVKVINGPYTGDTGKVVDVREEGGQFVAVVHTHDEPKRELKTRLNDLQKSTQHSIALDSLGGYELLNIYIIFSVAKYVH
jgi:transcription antitermination factor NusG